MFVPNWKLCLVFGGQNFSWQTGSLHFSLTDENFTQSDAAYSQ